MAIASIVENPDIFPENVPNPKSINNRLDCLVTIAEKMDTFPGNVLKNATTVDNPDTSLRNAWKQAKSGANSKLLCT